MKYTRNVAITTVIANMIGTGVFTSLGFQLLDFPSGIPDAFAIMMVWTIGGLIALCGAFAYAEIATTLKESGGEYLFLSKIYHPSFRFYKRMDFISCWFWSANCSCGNRYWNLFSACFRN